MLIKKFNLKNDINYLLASFTAFGGCLGFA